MEGLENAPQNEQPASVDLASAALVTQLDQQKAALEFEVLYGETYAGLMKIVEGVQDQYAHMDLTSLVHDELAEDIHAEEPFEDEEGYMVIFDALFRRASIAFERQKKHIKRYDALMVRQQNMHQVPQEQLLQARKQVLENGQKMYSTLVEAYHLYPTPRVSFLQGIVAYDLGRVLDDQEEGTEFTDSHRWYDKAIRAFTTYLENPLSLLKPQEQGIVKALIHMTEIKNVDDEEMRVQIAEELRHLCEELTAKQRDTAALWRVAATALTQVGDRMNEALEMLHTAADKDPLHSDALVKDPELHKLYMYSLQESLGREAGAASPEGAQVIQIRD